MNDKNSLSGANATTPEILNNFLFIDISSSPKLVAAIDAPWDYNWTDPWILTTVETRKTENFPRIGFVFTEPLSPNSTLPSDMEFEVQFYTSGPIASSDFADLPIIWGGGTVAAYSSYSGGRLVGSTVPTTRVETSELSNGDIVVSFSGFLQSSDNLSSWSTISPQPISPLIIPRSEAISQPQLFFRSARNSDAGQ